MQQKPATPRRDLPPTARCSRGRSAGRPAPDIPPSTGHKTSTGREENAEEKKNDILGDLIFGSHEFSIKGKTRKHGWNHRCSKENQEWKSMALRTSKDFPKSQIFFPEHHSTHDDVKGSVLGQWPVSTIG